MTSLSVVFVVVLFINKNLGGIKYVLS